MKHIQLIVGLGNPGAEYETTRHNLGFMLIEKFATARGLTWKKHGKTARIAKDHTDGLLLLEPLTYMNISGEPVAFLMRENNIPPDQVLVVSDDLAIPLGSIRLRAGGSAGGHNGLSSIIQYIGTQQFARLRLGMGPLPSGADAAAFVLARFPAPDLAVVDKMLTTAIAIVNAILEHGVEKTISVANTDSK